MQHYLIQHTTEIMIATVIGVNLTFIKNNSCKELQHILVAHCSECVTHYFQYQIRHYAYNINVYFCLQACDVLFTMFWFFTISVYNKKNLSCLEV